MNNEDIQVKPTPTEIAFFSSFFFFSPLHQQVEGKSSGFPGSVDPRQHIYFSAVVTMYKSQLKCVPLLSGNTPTGITAANGDAQKRFRKLCSE